MTASILCVNMNYIGDALMTTPSLARMADASGEPVDVIASPSALEILRGNPSVGRLIAREASGSTARCAQLFREIRSGKYSQVAILASIPVYRSVALAAGAKSVLYVQPLSGGAHMAEHMARTVERFYDLPSAPVEMSLAISPDARGWARRQLAGMRGMPALVALNIGATRPQKRWPPEQFAECIALLARHEISAVLIGGPDDRAIAARIAAQCDGIGVVDLTGKTSISEMAGVIDLCDALVTADTGALHIAAALKKPVVALFGSTDPATTGPIGSGEHIVLYNRMACSPCNSRPTCGGRFDCMRSLQAQQVAESVDQLLKTRRRVGAGAR